MNRTYLYVVAVIAVAAAIGWGLLREHGADGASSSPPKARLAPTVAVATAVKADIARVIDLDGSVEASRVARIASPAEGPIGSCRLREGDHVKKGQQIICIGRRETVQAQLAAARVDLTKEQAELERVIKLVDNGAIPGDQLSIAQARVENARAQLIRLQQSNEDYRLAAPWDGVIAKVMVLEGDYVAPRAPLMEIIDPDSMVVRFAVPEVHAQAVALGKTIEVSLDGYPGQAFKARISRIYPRLDPALRTRTAEAVLVGGVTLLPGMFARIRLEVEQAVDATLVPAEAVLTGAGGKPAVFVVENGKAKRLSVVTGIEAGGRIQIVKGLVPGASVVVAGNEKLKDGAEVKVAAPKDKPAIDVAPKAGI